MNNNKNRTLIVLAIIILIAVVAGGYVYWKNKQSNAGEKAIDKASNASEKITDSATKGVLPSVGANPLESKPDINPADKANPFTNIKTNPFE